jgi:UDP-arabinose 4-epimerase
VPHVEIFGNDYPTPDGTAVRDYIHVADLADAHIKALKHLLDGKDSVALNLGTGKGNSVREVIQAVEKVSGRKVPVKEGPRRAGDPPELVADARKANSTLGWKPQYADINTIVQHAWRWHASSVTAGKK